MTVKVPIYGSPVRAVQLDERATEGAVFGVNLRWPDGKLVKASDFATSTSGAQSLGTTDDLDEGQWNLYFTPRRAQDAVGDILTDSANVTLRYAGGVSITADLTDLPDSGQGELIAFTRDAKGRVSGTRPITEADLPAIPAVAATALGYPRLVAVADGQAYLPDLSNPADMTRLAGFTDRAWAAGDSIRIVRTLVVSEPAWSWSPGLVFAAPGGTFTQSPDPALALVQVGVAVDSTTLALRAPVKSLQAGTGIAVDSTNPGSPIISNSMQIQAGPGIAVDSTNPAAPIISNAFGSIHIDAQVASYANLPNPPPAGVTAVYVQDTGLVYLWNGASYPSAGSGIPLAGLKTITAAATLEGGNIILPASPGLLLSWSDGVNTWAIPAYKVTSIRNA